jgi:hypothetical protein
MSGAAAGATAITSYSSEQEHGQRLQLIWNSDTTLFMRRYMSIGTSYAHNEPAKTVYCSRRILLGSHCIARIAGGNIVSTDMKQSVRIGTI